MLGSPALSLTKEGLSNQLEDGICLLLKKVLEGKGSRAFLRVKGVGTPGFDTDMDVLELRKGACIAYEVKGLKVRKKGRRKERTLTGVGVLEGLGQALNHLFNAGYSVDYVYLVHPILTFYGYFLRTKILLEKYTPIGYVVVDPVGKIVELVKPKPTEPIGKRLADVPIDSILRVSEVDVEGSLQKRIERISGLPIDILKESVIKGYNIMYK